MAKLSDGTRVYGSLLVDNALISSGTLMQMAVLTTSGTYTFPTSVQVPGSVMKITVIGAGGQGGGSAATAGSTGGGGGSGSVAIIYLIVLPGVYSFTYTIGVGGTTGTAGAVGQAGTSSTIVYNGITYTSAGGSGGLASTTFAGGAAGAIPTISGTSTVLQPVFNRVLYAGQAGGYGGTDGSNNHHVNKGGDTPLKYGRGGLLPSAAAGSTGLAGLGYGSGGGGARSGTTAATQIGGAGASGLIVVEY
jgi:hypothetical protein